MENMKKCGLPAHLKRVGFLFSFCFFLAILTSQFVCADQFSMLNHFHDYNKTSKYSKYNSASIARQFLFETSLNAGNAGVSAQATRGGGNLSGKWDVNLNGGGLFSPTINPSGVVGYVTANTFDFETGDPKGRLNAVNLADGGVRWGKDVNGFIAAAPVVDAEGTIYIVVNALDEDAISNGILFAVDANGKTKWTFNTNGVFTSAPVVGPDGAIFFGTDSFNIGFVYAINPLSIDDPNNVKPAWAFQTTGVVSSSPLVMENGIVFVGTNFDPFGKVYALDANQGIVKWEFLTEGPVIVSLKNRGGIVAAATTIVKTDDEDNVSLKSSILAFDTENLDPNNVKTIWEKSIDGGVSTNLLILKDTLYFGTSRINLTLPDEGAENAGNVITENPSGFLNAVKLADGNEKWKVNLNSLPVSSPVAGPNGSVLISANQIVAVGKKSLTAKVFAVSSSGAIINTGDIKGNAVLSAPAVDLDGIAYVGTAGFDNKEGITGKLIARDLTSGKTETLEINEAVLSAPIVRINDLTNEKVVYFSSGGSGDGGLIGVFYAVNVDRGNIEPDPSTISIDDVSPAEATLGSPIAIGGKIDPAPNAEVPVLVTINDALGRVFEIEAFADAGGRFLAEDVFAPGGKWDVNAAWRGNSELLGAKTESPAGLTINPADTKISVSASSLQITTKDLLQITGSISSEPDSAFARNLLSGNPIKLVRIGPNNEIEALIANTVSTEAGVEFAFNDLALLQAGEWQLFVSFEENNLNFNKSNLEELEIVVAGVREDAPGYVILAQGRAPSKSGEESYNLTANNIYKKLLLCGFSDEDIFYLNFDKNQAGITVDKTPSENEVKKAITGWAKDKLSLVPAPLYIVFVGPGREDGVLIDKDVLEAAELAKEIADLETALNEDEDEDDSDDESADVVEEDMFDENIVVIIGAPHSGSFIDDLSNAGRVIITSCDAREVSSKGPLAPTQTVRGGDFFVAELFRQALKGLSLKSSYESAALASMGFAENSNGNGLNGVDAGNGIFDDNAAFHPLLDDNGDGLGSNGQLSATVGNDGAVAANLALCVGVEGTGSANLNITGVLPFTTLAPDDDDPLLFAGVSDVALTSKIWNEIKTPDFDIVTKEGDTEQFTLDLPSFAGTISASANRFEWPVINDDGFGGFGKGGQYQVLYFTENKETGDNSAFDDNTSQTRIVRNDNASNTPPPAPGLSNISSGVVASALIVENSGGGNDAPALGLNKIVKAKADEDESDVTFTVLLSQDKDFNSIDVQVDGLTEKFVIVDSTAGLQLNTEYFWNVIAVNKSGAATSAKTASKVVTSASSGFPGFVKGIVRDKETNRPFAGASVKLLDRLDKFTTKNDGAYFFELPSGKYTLEAEGKGFKRLKAVINTVSFETTTKNFVLDKIIEIIKGPTSISVNPETAGKSFRMSEATVVVLDQEGAPVKGASVDAIAEGKGVKVKNTPQITDAGGKAVFKFKFGRRSKGGKIIFSVNNLKAELLQE